MKKMLPNMEENDLELCVAVLYIFRRPEKRTLCTHTPKIWRVDGGKTKS